MVILRSVRIDRRITSRFSNRYKIPNVAKAKGARRQMRDEIVQITNDVKTVPPFGNVGRQTSVEDARTSKSVAFYRLTELGAAVVGKFMAENCQCRAVAVAHGYDL